jgi:hypothetical protein
MLSHGLDWLNWFSLIIIVIRHQQLSSSPSSEKE